MKHFARFASLLLFFSCSSSDGFEANQTFDCEPGQPVTILAGFDAIHQSGMEGVDDQHTLVVLVANNSHQDIVVNYVRIDQRPDATAIYRLDNGYRKLDEVVPEGKEIEVKVPMAGRSAGSAENAMRRNRRSILLDVSVGLGNGDRYHCEFEVPIR